MKWVKCINIRMLIGGCSTRQLTVGKIYVVKETMFDSYQVLIKGDDDEERWYSLERFEDVTAEVRDNKLNELGI